MDNRREQSSDSNLQNYMERIFKTLGGGYKESVYQNALSHELRINGYFVSKEVNVPVLYQGVEVGVVRLDLLIENKYIIEFKALQKIGEKEKIQIKRY